MGAWTILQQQTRELLEFYDFRHAKGIFSIELMPANPSDRAFCITMAQGRRNPTFGDKFDRFYPIVQLRVSMIFEVGANDESRYNSATDRLWDAVRLLILPDNYSESTRISELNTVNTRFFQKSGWWLIADIYMDVETNMLYKTTLDENNLGFPLDEMTQQTLIYDEGAES